MQEGGHLLVDEAIVEMAQESMVISHPTPRSPWYWKIKSAFPFLFPVPWVSSYNATHPAPRNARNRRFGGIVSH